MPTRSTLFGFLSLAVLLSLPVLLIAVHGPRSTVHADERSVVHADSSDVTVCFDERTHRRLAKAFVAGKRSTERHRGCGLGLVQVQLDLDSAHELLGSLVAASSTRDQAIAREKKAEQRRP